MRKETARAKAMDYGVMWGFIVLIILFEAVPGSSIGRLATRTVTDEMQGFDPGELYEIPPEMPDEEPVDVEAIIQQEIPDVVEPTLVISTDTDTTGLGHASTVGTTDLIPDPPPEDVIPDPGTFIPHSVQPVCSYKPMPEYPEMARQAGVEGSVIRQVYISTDGVPAQAVIMQSSGLGSMDRAAQDAVLQSRWSPARGADGVPVAVWTSVIYYFQLED